MALPAATANAVVTAAIAAGASASLAPATNAPVPVSTAAAMQLPGRASSKTPRAVSRTSSRSTAAWHINGAGSDDGAPRKQLRPFAPEPPPVARVLGHWGSGER